MNLYNLSETWDSDLQIKLFIPNISNTEEANVTAAIGLLREGISPEIISRALGIPIDSIEKLCDRL